MSSEIIYRDGNITYETMDPSRRSPPNNYNTGLLVYNNSPYEASRNLSSDTQISGYSSTSPLGTASSECSTHSHCYGRSPEDSSMDSLISNILQVVGNDGLSSSCETRFSPALSSSFSSGSHSHECSDSPCDTCSGGQARNRQNSFNFIDQLSGLSSPTTIQLSVPTSTKLTYFNNCDVHKDGVQSLYCQTCSCIVCGECSTHRHHGHIMLHLVEAVDNAEIQANQVLKELNLGIASLREDLAAVQLAAEGLDRRARQAATDVMMCIGRVTSALQAREAELLDKIEKTRQQKFAALNARNEGLRNGIRRLSMEAHRISEAIESSKLIGSPLDLLIVKDMASAEVFQIRQNRQGLPSQEENWISFSGPEGHVLHAISNIGSVMENNPGSIGDRRAVKGRGTSPQPLRPINQMSQIIARGPTLRGRPIALNTFPVIVRAPHGSATTMPETFFSMGNDGTPDDLCRPWGVACDKDGHVIIADRSNDRIKIYREDGTFVRKFGTRGTGPGQFNRPAGLVVDSRKRIIVVDKDNHRVQILTMDGQFLLTFGEKGSRCGQFNYPWDVAANTDCQIVVTDTRNHRVQLFSPEGVFLRKYGYETIPSMWKHFDSPRGIAFSPDGNIITTDFNNHRVIMIDYDFMNAKVLECDTGSPKKPFHRPQGLIIDDEGNIVIADCRNNRIVVVDSTGALKWTFDSFDRGNEKLNKPSGVALTPTGRIVVVDFGNNRVLIF